MVFMPGLVFSMRGEGVFADTGGGFIAQGGVRQANRRPFLVQTLAFNHRHRYKQTRDNKNQTNVGVRL